MPSPEESEATAEQRQDDAILEPTILLQHLKELEKLPQISPARFSAREPTQRVHDADARVGFGIAIILFFVALLSFEAYACFGEHFCKDIHDVKDTFEGATFAVFTAFGAATGFFFAERQR